MVILLLEMGEVGLAAEDLLLRTLLVVMVMLKIDLASVRFSCVYILCPEGL